VSQARSLRATRTSCRRSKSAAEKIGEESSELVVALADQDHERAKEEAADLIYHSLVGLRALGSAWKTS